MIELKKRYPEYFFLRDLIDGVGYQYILQEKKIFEYILDYSTNDKFILISFFGNSQIGKSSLCQYLTGVGHKIGYHLKSSTKGATIVYGGTIKEIYERVNLQPPNVENLDIDVFFVDTEGICNEPEKDTIALQLIPLMLISSKNVAFTQPIPDSIVDFLKICKYFVNTHYSSDNEREEQNLLFNRLIARIVDFPDDIDEKYNQDDIKNLELDFKQNSNLAKVLNKQLIEPVYVPGGPYYSDKKCYDVDFTQYFLDQLFLSSNSIVYSDINTFMKNLIYANRNIKPFFKVNQQFKFRNYININIEEKINQFFMNCRENMDCQEDQINNFFEKEIKLLINQNANNKSIDEIDLNNYLLFAKNYFNSKKEELQKCVSKYNDIKFKIVNAKTNKEKIISQLQYLSDFVQVNGQFAANYIFEQIQNHYTNIDRYENSIFKYIDDSKDLCLRKLEQLQIDHQKIINKIKSDISDIFNILSQFKINTFYRQHGVFSWAISIFFDSRNELPDPEEIVPGFKAYINKKTKTYCRFVIENRQYESKFEKILDEKGDIEILSNLNTDQKNFISKYLHDMIEPKLEEEKIATLEKLFVKNENLEYVFQKNNILSYIMKNATHEKFLFYLLFGKSQLGKSSLCQCLTGVQHEIGNTCGSKTEGATIAYGGTIKEIYERLKLHPPSNEDLNCDVFVCDTEGIFNESENEKLALLLIPLMIISSKIVIFIPSSPDDSLTKFLAICKYFISDTYMKNNEQGEQNPFCDKLIARIVDYPDEDEDINYTPEDIARLTQEYIKESNNKAFFDQQMIEPIFVPGGPWDNQNKCYNQSFMQNFLDQLFANHQNAISYSNPTKFVDDINIIVNISIDENNENKMEMFKDKSFTERFLDYEMSIIEKNINNFYLEYLEKMKINEEENNKFIQNNIILELNDFFESHQLDQKYYEKYYQLASEKFNEKLEYLRISIFKYNEFNEQIKKAKNEKEKLIKTLKYLSIQIQFQSQISADYILYCVNTHYIKISMYEDDIISFLNRLQRICINFLSESNIKIQAIKDDINNDIGVIFKKLTKFKSFVLYREHGIFSRISEYFYNKKKIVTEEYIMAPGMIGIFDINTKKCIKIFVENRRYDNSDEIDRIDINKDKQLNKILNIKNQQNNVHLVNLSDDVINDLARNYATS